MASYGNCGYNVELCSLPQKTREEASKSLEAMVDELRSVANLVPNSVAVVEGDFYKEICGTWHPYKLKVVKAKTGIIHSALSILTLGLYNFFNTAYVAIDKVHIVSNVENSEAIQQFIDRTLSEKKINLN